MNHLDELISESLDRLHPAQSEQADWDDILTRLHNELAPARRAFPLAPAGRRRARRRCCGTRRHHALA